MARPVRLTLGNFNLIDKADVIGDWFTVANLQVPRYQVLHLPDNMPFQLRLAAYEEVPHGGTDAEWLPLAAGLTDNPRLADGDQVAVAYIGQVQQTIDDWDYAGNRIEVDSAAPTAVDVWHVFSAGSVRFKVEAPAGGNVGAVIYESDLGVLHETDQVARHSRPRLDMGYDLPQLWTLSIQVAAPAVAMDLATGLGALQVSRLEAHAEARNLSDYGPGFELEQRARLGTLA